MGDGLGPVARRGRAEAAGEQHRLPDGLPDHAPDRAVALGRIRRVAAEQERADLPGGAPPGKQQQSEHERMRSPS